MTTFPWPRELVVKALRPWIIGNGGVSGRFIGLDVRPALEGEPPDYDGVLEHLVVVLRWQHDPCVYAIAVPLEPDGADEDPSLPPGLSTGLPIASLEEFVGEVVLWLSEEFATGLVRRATRTRFGVATTRARQRCRPRGSPPNTVGSTTTTRACRTWTSPPTSCPTTPRGVPRRWRRTSRWSWCR